MNKTENEELKIKQCCPLFNPNKWNEKLFIWKDKKFIKDHVFTLFFIPINFGKVITRLVKKIDLERGHILDNICLSDHISKWNMDIYLSVDKKIPGLNNVSLSGKFLSKVYEGDFKNTNIWCDDFKKFAKEKNYDIQKWYMWYTTCPKCAKKYGKNYVVIIAQVNDYQ